jgi:hypothetical protein
MRAIRHTTWVKTYTMAISAKLAAINAAAGG